MSCKAVSMYKTASYLLRVLITDELFDFMMMLELVVNFVDRSSVKLTHAKLDEA